MGAFAALTALWSAQVAPELPPAKRAPLDGVRRFVWIGPGHGGHWTNRSPWDVECLAIGDSRAGTGFDPHVFEEAGFGDSTVLWGGSALVVGMVEFATTETDARSLIVSLTPRSLCFETSPFLVDLLDRRPLTARPAPGESEPELEDVRAWERALEEEIGAARYAAAIETLAGGYHAERARRRVWSAGIDASLAVELGRTRRALVRAFDPAPLGKGWVRDVDPHFADEDYRRHFALPGAEGRAIEALDALEAALEAAAASGKRVACVRFPVSPSLRAIEDGFLDPGAFGRACAGAGVPFLDLGSSTSGTLDGSHLDGEAQTATSRRIARWLTTEHGW